MTDRRIEYLPLGSIQSAARNPKRHAEGEIRRSIGHFGLAELPLIDERTGLLVAGHGRRDQLVAMHEAGQQPPDGVQVDDAGAWLMPVVRGWASRSDMDAEAYLVASNHLTTLGGWDEADLGVLLSGLNEYDPELLELTGFSEGDLAELLEDEVEPTDTDEDDLDAGPGEPPSDPVTKQGDVWLLGPHRLICGDSRDYETVAKLLNGRRVNVAFTSPPYASQRTYDETSGFKPIRPDEYVDWFEDVQANVRAVLAEDGSWFVNIKENSDDGQRVLYVKDLVVAHVRRWGWSWIEELCWLRNALPGSPDAMRRFKNAFEPVFQFATSLDWKFRPAAVMHESDAAFSYEDQKAAGKRITASAQGDGGGAMSPVGQGEGMAYPSNVLEIKSGANVVGHSAAFPVALPAWFIRAYSDEGDAIFDPFMGSGTTIIAAEQHSRVAYGTEISPGYCDVICRRYQSTTGTKPILEATGEPHDFTSED